MNGENGGREVGEVGFLVETISGLGITVGFSI